MNIGQIRLIIICSFFILLVQSTALIVMIFQYIKIQKLYSEIFELNINITRTTSSFTNTGKIGEYVDNSRAELGELSD